MVAEKQEVTVQAEAGPTVSVEPDNNATALVIKGGRPGSPARRPRRPRRRAPGAGGPGAGPNGGSIYIDGFSGGQLPPKESIREIRINQNPFSAEFDRLGFGRIEILTKPGSDRFRGTLSSTTATALQFPQPVRLQNKPDFSNRMFSGNIGGPINKKASFFVDFNRRKITTTRSSTPSTSTPPPCCAEHSEAVVTPNTRTTIAPRIDYQLTTNNTLTGRFE